MQFNSVAISRLVGYLVAIALIIAMIGLGFWQLNRAAYKAEKQQNMDQRIGVETQQLPSHIVDAEEWAFFRVSVSGEYLPELGFLVDNIINKSVPGVSAVTPMRIKGSQTLILVDRGWLGWAEDRTFLPVVETPEGDLDITGLLVPAAKDHFYLTDPETSGERKQLWSQLDINRFINMTSNPVQPLILILDDGQPGSYEFIWQIQDDNWIARHKAYAVQWFGLALTLLVITVLLGYKHRKLKDYS